MRTVLVTGANGFIGNRLCQAVLDSGHYLHAAFRQHHSHADFSCRKHIVVGDISHDTQWKEALQNVDCVIHLAARVHVMNETATDPLSEFRLVNVNGTINLAQQAIVAGVKRFIYLSSIKVNGEVNQTGLPFKADAQPVPVDSYAISKYEAELSLFKIALKTGMDVVIIRPPLVYGPGVKANFLHMKMERRIYRELMLIPNTAA